jgi:hypothetical protein
LPEVAAAVERNTNVALPPAPIDAGGEKVQLTVPVAPGAGDAVGISVPPRLLA